MLRDLAGSAYLRQEQDGILVGPYEELPISAVHREWGRQGPPMTWAWDLFPDKVDRLEGVMEHAMTTVPALQEVGFASVVNGPTIWAPDSLPRCGRTSIPGYYDFNTLTYGIAHSMPLAEHLKAVMLDGEQPWDLAAECDPLRYGAWANDDYAAAKIVETYSYNNQPGYPANFENRKAGRDLAHATPALAALATLLKQRGAVTSFSQGVETALAFPDKAVQLEARFDAHEWADAAVKEAQVVRSSVGVGAMTGFSKLVVKSRDNSARSLLLQTTTNVVPSTPGACRLTYAVAPKRGSVVAEFTVSNVTNSGLVSHAPDETAFYVVGSRDYAAHDLQWLKTQADALGLADKVEILDASNDVEILLLAGPNSKATLLGLLDHQDDAALIAALGFLKFSTRPVQVAGTPGVNVARVSFTGEAGYELHVPAASAASLLEELLEKRAIAPFGAHATNSLRLEKGFKVKGDLDFARYDEAGINAFMRKSWTPPVIGSKPSRIAALFQVKTEPGFEWSVPSDCPIFDADDRLIGFTTTSAYGTEAQATISAGFLKLDAVTGEPLATPQSPGLTVECFGVRAPCHVLESPPAPVRGFDKPQVKTDEPFLATPATPRTAHHHQMAQQRSLSTSTTSSTQCPTSSGVLLTPDPTQRGDLLMSEQALSYPRHVAPWMREEYFEASRLSFEKAHCFGGAMYTDERIHADERRAIFKREWICVGHTSELSKHGDVVPFDVAGAPFFAANDKGTIKAYHNVCRHRGAKLVNRPMTGRAVVSCPYHKWGYALDGRLVGTPCWDEIIPPGSSDRQLPIKLKSKFDTVSSGFKRAEYGLFKCELQAWGGMLFARVGDHAGDPAAGVGPGGTVTNNISLEQHLGDLIVQLRNYPLHETVVVRQRTIEDIQSNWKILAENFSEYYHLPAVHPELCTVSGVDDHIRTQGKGKYLGFATSPLTNGGTFVDPNVAPIMPGLEGTPDAYAARHILIYPNVFMSFYPHHIFRVILEPMSAGVTRERTHVLVHPSIYDQLGKEKAEETIDNFMTFHQKVNTEDFSICEAVQRGVAAAPYAGGRLSFRFEETIHRYQNLVADSLVGLGNRTPEGDDAFDPLMDLTTSS